MSSRGWLLALGIAMAAGAARAQVVLDGSLGVAGELPRDAAGDVRIDQSVGARSGPNLFHSFSRFDVPRDTSATFAGDAGIARVIARVGGGSPSRIDGLLRSEIPGADLYLLNSRGVLFGSGARLDLGGSLVLGSAHALEFEDGIAYEADAAAPLRLSSAPPEAWSFSGPTGALEIRGARLEVGAGQLLSLTGSRIDLAGSEPRPDAPDTRLVAPGGRVELAAAGGEGRVRLGSTGLVPEGSQAGDVALHVARIDVSSEQGSGTISVRARDLSLEASDLFADTPGVGVANPVAIDLELEGDLRLSGAETDVTADHSGPSTGGSILVRVRGDVVLQDRALIGALALGAGDGGRIELSAETLAIAGGAELLTQSAGAGRAGDVVIHASELELEGLGSLLGSQTEASSTGRGGDVRIDAGELAVREGAQVRATTLGRGDGGDLVVSADRIWIEGAVFDPAARDGDGVSVSGLQTDEQDGAFGRAGGVRIEAEHIEVREGGAIGRYSRSAVPGATAELPDAEIRARELVVSGWRSVSTASGDIVRPALVTAATRERDAGALRILAERVDVSDGGQISATTSGAGDAGRLEIEASRVSLRGSASPAPTGIFSRSQRPETDPRPAGDGGEIRIRAGQLTIASGARISAEAIGRADAGEIDIDVGSGVVDLERGSISTRAVAGAGGNVAIRAGRLVRLQDSAIETSVTTGAEPGGNISIDPELVVLNRSSIRANANAGRGGNIDIVAEQLVRSADSVISASSALDLPGEISLRSPVEDLEGESARIEAEYLDPGDLLGEGCAGRARAASLTRVGRRAASAEPGAALTPDVGSGPGGESCARDR